MPSPTLSIGRMVMREDLTAAEQSDGSGARSIALAGQESIPRFSAVNIAKQREDFLTMSGQFVPVVFSRKTYLNGFYTIDDCQGTMEDWGDGVTVFRWQANLTRAGTESEVDIESRLSGSTTRINDFSVVGERTHAPAITHGAYWTNATVTSSVSRTGADGVLKLYRGVGATTNPRWATSPVGYSTGRVRFFDDMTRERAGDAQKLVATSWELNNGLVRVKPLLSGGVLEVSAYTSGSWHAKNWDVLIDAVSVGAFDYCTLLSNQYEAISVRLMKILAIGRFYLDITLRRGHRFAELVLTNEYGATLKVVRATADAGVNTLAGTVVDAALDGDNNKYIIGSARTFTADTINGGISKAATTTLDAFVGVVAGSSPVTGDAAADLQKQYIGMPNEMVQGGVALMAVTETLRALGSWGVSFNKKMPDDVWKRIEYFGHICIHVGRNPGPLDDSLLKSARYVGPVRSISDDSEDARSIGGLGMATWLGDPDGKADIIKDPLVVNGPFHTVIAQLLPASGSITAGSIFNIGQNFSTTFQFVDPRAAIDYVCQTVGGPPAAWRVNGDGTLDAGLESQLFATTPKCVVVNKRIARNVAAFEDMVLKGLAGTAQTARDVEDYTTDVLLLAQGVNGQFVQAEANTPPANIPFVDIHGNKVKLERIVQESETDATNAPARAQLQLNRFSGSRDALTLSTSNYDIKGDAEVGDYLWVYDPEMGLIDTANEIPWRAQRINPFKLRLTETTWPITSKMSVFYRSGSGQWIDLTKYVIPESGETSLVVGGYNRSLSEGGGGAFPVSPPPDTSVPDVVTWIEPFRLSTYQSDVSGEARGEVILTWNQPDNVDSSTITDGDHYEIRYRKSTTPLYPTTWDQLEATGMTWNAWEATGATWDEPIQFAETEWQTAFAPFDVQTFRLQELVPSMVYEAQVRAVDGATPPNVGAWSLLTEWQTSADDIPPSTPAAAIVAANPMAVQITHNLGVSTGGTFNLERDLHHLEVHGGNNIYFYPDDGSLLGKVIANYGMMVAQTPVVATFPISRTTPVYYKVIAVDNTGNKSNPSPGAIQTAQLISSQYISDLTASKITSGTITSNVLVSGRVATMPDGGFPGVELTSQGIEGWNTSGTRPLHWDSSTGALHVDGQGGIDIQDGRLLVRNGAGVVIVEIGECADGRHGVQVYKDNGTRVARIGELASSVDEGIELLNDLGNLVRLSNVVFGISSDYNVSLGNVSGTGAWVDLSGQPNSPTCQATIGNTGKAMVIIGASLISSNGAYLGMSVRVDGPGGYVRNPDTLESFAAGGPSGAVLAEGSRAFLFDGMPAGVCTFTAKYWYSGGGTGQAAVRTIAVLPY